MRRIYLAMLLVASLGLALVLSACGGPTVPGTPSSTQLSSASAGQMATMGMYGNDLLAAMMAPGSGNFSILSAGAKALGITNVSPFATSCNDAWTNNVDNDNDGVRANASITYTCTYTYGGTTMLASGSISEKDYNDSDPNSGYEIHLNNLKFTMSGSGGTFSMTENGDFVLQTASNGGYTAQFNLTLGYDDGQGSAMTIAWTGNPSYTPDSGTTGFDAGTFHFNGTLSFDDGAGNTYDLTYQTFAAGLHYNAACSSGADFDSGSISYSDGTNQVTLTYNGCGTGSYTFSGGGSGTF